MTCGWPQFESVWIVPLFDPKPFGRLASKDRPTILGGQGTGATGGPPAARTLDHPAMPLPTLHHIGIAVRSLDEHRSLYETTWGAELESVESLPEQGVRVAFYRLANVRLELIEPIGTEGPMTKFLDSRGEGLHHLAMSVDDLDDRLEQLRSDGFRLIDPSPRPGAHDSQVAFVHPSDTGRVLVELCQTHPA